MYIYIADEKLILQFSGCIYSLLSTQISLRKASHAKIIMHSLITDSYFKFKTHGKSLWTIIIIMCILDKLVLISSRMVTLHTYVYCEMKHCELNDLSLTPCTLRSCVVTSDMRLSHFLRATSKVKLGLMHAMLPSVVH